MAEKMVGLVPVVKKPKSFGRWDTYALVITDVRSIFTQLTGDMLKEAAKEAQRKGKEEGKGFMQRWADQLKATFAFSERYWDIPPEDILNENPGNFAIPNSDISSIKIKHKEEYRGNNTPYQTLTEMQIESKKGKHAFNIDGYSDDIANVLKGIFGDKVKPSRW
jgi:hypothetical protein